ncbi:DUF5990 family protein [Streptomyces sp. NPDC020472]|uniref:DUF5990 family protein n=1 Tax=Streptomyces sp. NPDC020472 TaxID=3365075 RepID=UPI003798B1ED
MPKIKAWPNEREGTRSRRVPGPRRARPAGCASVCRRVELMLDAVPVHEPEAAVSGGLLVGRLGLTDACGDALCARVVPPRVTWTAQPRD